MFVRFFPFSFPAPPPPAAAASPFFFFFAFVTLIGSGVPDRGSSTSRSYAGNRDGSGATAPSGVADLLPCPWPWPFPYEGACARCEGAGEAADRGGGELPGRRACGETRGAATVTPSGISPARSITNVCVGGAGALRRLGRRGVVAAAVKDREARWSRAVS